MVRGSPSRQSASTMLIVKVFYLKVHNREISVMHPKIQSRYMTAGFEGSVSQASSARYPSFMTGLYRIFLITTVLKFLMPLKSYRWVIIYNYPPDMVYSV